MTAQEELEQALAELAAANAELAKAEAELAAIKTKKRAAKRTKPVKAKHVKRPVHHSKLTHEITGYGGPMPSDVRYRFDDTEVVTRHLNPTDRPVEHEYVKIECLFEFDIKEGRTESDSWRRCMCAGCAELRNDAR